MLLVEPGAFRTDWAGRSAREVAPARQIPDYAATADDMRTGFFRAGAGREPGDPARAAQAVITPVNAGNPPGRLVLGSAAHDMATDKLDRLREELAAWGNPCPAAPTSPRNHLRPVFDIHRHGHPLTALWGLLATGNRP